VEIPHGSVPSFDVCPLLEDFCLGIAGGKLPRRPTCPNPVRFEAIAAANGETSVFSRPGFRTCQSPATRAVPSWFFPGAHGQARQVSFVDSAKAYGLLPVPLASHSPRSGARFHHRPTAKKERENRNARDKRTKAGIR